MLLNSRRIVVKKWVPLLPLIIALAACNKSNKPSFSSVYFHPKKQARRYWKRQTGRNQNAALAIFGTESKEIIFSGDAVQDKAAVDRFKVAYGVMHRWRKMPDGTQVLLVGADNFPFPIPFEEERWRAMVLRHGSGKGRNSNAPDWQE